MNCFTWLIILAFITSFHRTRSVPLNAIYLVFFNVLKFPSYSVMWFCVAQTKLVEVCLPCQKQWHDYQEIVGSEQIHCCLCHRQNQHVFSFSCHLRMKSSKYKLNKIDGVKQPCLTPMLITSEAYSPDLFTLNFLNCRYKISKYIKFTK